MNFNATHEIAKIDFLKDTTTNVVAITVKNSITSHETKKNSIILFPFQLKNTQLVWKIFICKIFCGLLNGCLCVCEELHINHFQSCYVKKLINVHINFIHAKLFLVILTSLGMQIPLNNAFLTMKKLCVFFFVNEFKRSYFQ